jgi:hypothetical protein
MRPLTLEDLLPLEEFAAQRRALFEAHARYLDRYRRVRVGPRLTLLFENRQTLWFRVQELLRVARLNDAARVQQELDVYNRLLPGRGTLQAAVLVEVADEARLTEELAPWRAFRGEELRLRLGGVAVPAELVTCRPEDLAVGTAHWVQFALDGTARRRLGEPRRPAYFEVALPGYQHAGEPLGEEVRQSLLEDLALSDRDAA